jgi:hypothetical protein
MALTPLELGLQPLSLEVQTQKKTPTDKELSSSRGRHCPIADLLFCLGRQPSQAKVGRVYIKWLGDQAFSFYGFDKYSL